MAPSSAQTWTQPTYILDADGKSIRVPQYKDVGRSIELFDTEEAKAVEEELVELMTDQIERDTQ